MFSSFLRSSIRRCKAGNMVSMTKRAFREQEKHGAVHSLGKQELDVWGKGTGAQVDHGVTVADLEVDAEVWSDSVADKAAEIYKTHGALVLRGINKKVINEINSHIKAQVSEAQRLYEEGQIKKVPEGWVTLDGTLWIPTMPAIREKLGRDKTMMILGVDYYTSAALLNTAVDPRCLDVVERIVGPNIELFGKGQVFYKEADGGVPKLLHQDNAYFEFKYDGPIVTLNYAVDTSVEKNNGPIYVIPGTHK